MGVSYPAMNWIYEATTFGCALCGRELAPSLTLVFSESPDAPGFYLVGTTLASKRYCVDVRAVPIPPSHPRWPYGHVIGPAEPL